MPPEAVFDVTKLDFGRVVADQDGDPPLSTRSASRWSS